MPFEDIKGPLSNWVTTESIQRQIKLRFRAFLDQFRDENNNLVYKQRVRDMCIGEGLLVAVLVPCLMVAMFWIVASCASKAPFLHTVQCSCPLSEEYTNKLRQMTSLKCCRRSAKPAGGLRAACSCSDRHLPLAAVPAKDCHGAFTPGCQGGSAP